MIGPLDAAEARIRAEVRSAAEVAAVAVTGAAVLASLPAGGWVTVALRLALAVVAGYLAVDAARLRLRLRRLDAARARAVTEVAAAVADDRTVVLHSVRDDPPPVAAGDR